MGNGARRLLLGGTILVMAVVTALLCIFLLFKVSDIQITGDKVYQDSEILSRCDYQIGDNLVFLTTGDREEKLKEELPYIENVEIRRHIPGTLEIHITGAQVVSCVSGGNSWLYVSKGNKILEQKDVPKDGVLQVTGLASLNTAPGQPLKTEDEAVLAAYGAVMAKIVELDAAAKFTKLDLTDLYDIRLTYEDRVVFKLGGAAELDYKIQFGYDIVSDPERIGSQEKGELDLSDAADVKKASFTAGTSNGSASSQTSSAPESGTDSSGSESGRDGEIPDELYTGDSGGSPEEGGTDEAGDNGDTGDTGNADGGWDEGGTDDTGDTWDAGEPDAGDTGDWIEAGDGAGTDDGGTQ